MDFFERQERARRKTKWLVVYFLLAVVLITAAVYPAAWLMVAFSSKGRQPVPFWNPEMLGAISAVTLGIIGIGSLYKIWQLKSGGAAVATALGGEPIDLNTTDPDQRKLLNVVEEMAIASGTAVPQLFLLEDEAGINAFAAGHSRDDVAIGVTRGALTHLTRDELQGVIAHEFSHILNGDMRLNLRLMGFVHGILCLALVGQVLMRSHSRGSSRRNSGVGLILLGVALFLIGYIGVFFGRLIKSAVSRQREFLADAAAVQFTRNPSGLAGALKKIGGLSYGSRLAAANAEEASHLFFGNGMRESWVGLLSTHPPLLDRIRELEPSFDGTYPKIKLAEPQRPPPVTRETAPAPARRRLPVLPPVFAVAAGETLAQLAEGPSAAHLAYAAALQEQLPEPLERAARETFGATALVYALLLSRDAAVQSRQWTHLKCELGEGTLTETQRLFGNVTALPAPMRLPLIDLAVPALRQLSASQYVQFKNCLKQLIEADRSIDLFEYALQKVVRRHLDPHFEKAPRSIVQYYAIKAVQKEVRILLSGLAHIGHSDAPGRDEAFANGAAALQIPESSTWTMLPFAECNLSQIDRALDAMNALTPPLKKKVLEACAYTVATDGAIQTREAELLRAIGDTLDCPLPPFIYVTPGAA
jgi:Zn-dependent protease with chaperone function